VTRNGSAGSFRFIPAVPPTTWDRLDRMESTPRPPDDVDLVAAAAGIFADVAVTQPEPWE
jgi:hypothetical protein